MIFIPQESADVNLQYIYAYTSFEFLNMHHMTHSSSQEQNNTNRNQILICDL